MRFFSDNAAAAHLAVIDALGAANRLDTAYDGDALSRRLDGAFSELFGTEVAPRVRAEVARWREVERERGGARAVPVRNGSR